MISLESTGFVDTMRAGSTFRIELGAGARLLARLTRKASEGLGLGEGTSVYAQVKAVALAPGRGEWG